MGYGQNGHIGISFQETWGVQYTNSMHYFPFVSESLAETLESLMAESLNARYEEPDEYEGMHGVAGDVVIELHPHLVGKILKAWSGQASGGTFQNSCYKHIFVPRNTDWLSERCALPPMSIEVYRDTGSAYLYYDMLLNQLTLEIAQGALYKGTASFIGAHFAWLAKSTPSYIPGSYFSWDTCSIQLSGSAVSDTGKLQITLNNNLVAKAYMDGTKFPNRILRDGYRTIEVAGTMLLSGDQQVRNYRAMTPQRLLIAATDPTTVMGHHNQLIIDIPRMVYTEFPANIGGPNLIEVEFKGKGKWDSTSSYAVQFTLTNTTPSY